MQALVSIPRCLNMAMAENRSLAMMTRTRPKKIPFPVQGSFNVVIIDDPDNAISEQDFCAKNSLLDLVTAEPTMQENLQDHPADCRKIILVNDKSLGVENFPDESGDGVKSPPTPQAQISTRRRKILDFEDEDSIAANLMIDCNDLEEGEICPELCTEIGKGGAKNVARNGDETEYFMVEKSNSQHLEQLKAIKGLKRRRCVPSSFAQFKPPMKRARTKTDCKKQRIIWRFKTLSHSQNRDPPISSLQRLPEHKGSSSTSPLKHLKAQKLSSLPHWPDNPFVSDTAKANASATLPPSCHDQISDGKDSGSYKQDEEADHVTSSNDPRTLVMQTLETFAKLHTMYKHGKVKNVDLRARSDMKSMWINTRARIGPVPGVEVGDIFFYRSEVHIIGLHRQLQGGITWLSAKDSTYGDAVAVSIVASGGYEDDKDSGDVLHYAGQGGNVYHSRDRRQIADQELTRGNLAMKNSYTHQLPIRVIRGSPDKRSPSGTIYSYDGLYKIRKYWFENGVAGFKVYQFELVRLPGHPKLETSRRYLVHQRHYLYRR